MRVNIVTYVHYTLIVNITIIGYLFTRYATMKFTYMYWILSAPAATIKAIVKVILNGMAFFQPLLELVKIRI